ncbi:MAG: T9SS type A sorting domain-containing protein [Bacteroidetes bacterium]|nr:T9SS C-terminal target domain-containing protein [Bacteroidota bacterium]NOG56901.1 T9SS type A sorting domain-containing protein [Bacteroidota bacterium]
MKLPLQYIFLLFFNLLFISNFLAQTTIWSENFETGYSDNDETAQDNNLPSGADWTKTGSPSNWWRVESDNVLSGNYSMSGRNTNGIMTWTSETITISGYTNVSISISLKEVNCEAGDYIETYYNIGSGNVEFGAGNGDGNFNAVTNSITNLNATSLIIVVKLLNNSGNERLIFDNILVQGTPIPNGHLGPGGVGDIDGTGDLKVWLRADDLDADNDFTDNPANNSRVSTWADYSGNSNNYTNTGNNRPTYNSSGTYKAVKFNAASANAEYLIGASSGSYSDASAFFVTKAVDPGQNALLFDNPTYSLRIEQYSNTGLVGFTRYGIADYTSSLSSIFGSVALYSFHKTSASSNITIRVNNGQSNVGVGSSAAGIPYDRIGENSTTVDEASGDIMEVILFENKLNAAQINIVDNYLSSKYGSISINSDLYDEDNPANGDYDYDVAGIGQAADGSKHEDAQGTGIIRIKSPSNLGNNEYLFWGHDNGALDSYLVTDLPTGIESRVERRWRFSETGDVGTVTIIIDMTNIGGSIDAADLRLLIDADGDGEFNDEPGTSIISGAVNLSGKIFQWTGVSIFNSQGLSIGSTDKDDTPLPIILKHFNAELNSSKHVELTWETMSEINNHFFTIEKSLDCIDWKIVAEIKGAGNSAKPLKYFSIDESPYPDISYYRLKQTDFDGSCRTFDPVLINKSTNYSTTESLSIFPNPGDGKLIFLLFENFASGDYLIELIDLSGKVILNRKIHMGLDNKSFETEILNGLSLKKGNYIIQVKKAGKTVKTKYFVI